MLAGAVVWTGCGGGGGSSNSDSTTGSAFGVVRLLAHEPAADAVQVPLAASIDLEFDAPMALDSFGDEDTWLRVAGTTTNVAGTFDRGGSNRVRFTPAAPLAAETDYVFQLSPLTCDESGRILDVVVTFGFRTFDSTPPAIATIDVANGATNESRTRSFTVTFDESIARASVGPTSIWLRDIFNTRYAADYVVAGAQVTLDPRADLPGDRQFWLVVSDRITDRSGNEHADDVSTQFRTIADADSPAVVTAWPEMNRTGVSPRVQPTFTFDESMDPATVEAASLLFQDEFGSIVPFAVDSSPDQRTLRLRPTAPLAANRRYTIAFLLGAAGATDVSGNVIEATLARTWTTGTDATPPAIVGSSPASGDTRIPGALIATITCDEELDTSRVGNHTVALTVAGEDWAAVVERPTPTTIRVTPVLSLPTDAPCELTVRGGQAGLRDLAGNVLATDAVIAFTTSGDAGTPSAMLLPPDGAAGTAPTSHVTVVFDAPMDPTTLTTGTIRVTDDLGTPLPGTLVLTGDNRVATFTPAVPFSGLTWYRIQVPGGSAGPRRTTGNWLPADRTSRFRTNGTADNVPPTVTATLNGIHSSRTSGLVVPPSGFTVDVTMADTATQYVDPGSVRVLLSGAGTAPGAETLLAAATIGYGSFRVQVPSTTPLAAGSWTLAVQASDLSGNVGSAPMLSFTVAQPSNSNLPFERVQVVWVRADLDRDGNGTADFDDDLFRLGFATTGDPIGTNARMRRVLLDGILAKSSHLYGRGSRGEPLADGSVSVRFTTRQPIRIPHMQMALGGLDPEGDRYRAYGDDSTGVLGRAYYDYKNDNVAERNTANSPGLGVFPAEMWLYQTRIHQQVWPAYQTAFAQKFRPLCPDMGGVPAGSHALDAVVLSPAFDYATANPSQRSRWQTIMDAADDWAAVIGIILAHEVGHSLGLVAPGAAPGGLFGDSSLHDSYAGASEVMAPSVGYEAMTTLDYAFRDIDLAYLRQRLLLQ